jgi:hypothetical protein
MRQPNTRQETTAIKAAAGESRQATAHKKIPAARAAGEVNLFFVVSSSIRNGS